MKLQTCGLRLTLTLLLAAVVLSGCNLEDSRLGDGELPYQLTLGTTYADVVLPATHADHWQFTAPNDGIGDVSVEITTLTMGLNARISATTEGAGVWSFNPNHGGSGIETRNTSSELAPGGGTFYLIIDVTGNGGATYSLTVTIAP